MLSTCQSYIYAIYVYLSYVKIYIINAPVHYGTFEHTAKVGVIVFASQIKLVDSRFSIRYASLLGLT